jgi:hypothetical protein
MPRRGPQRRRTISVRPESYAALLEYAHANQRTASDVIEEQIARVTGGEYSPSRRAPKQPEAYKLPPPKPMKLTPPREIPTKRPATRRPPSSDPIGRARKLDIPEGRDVKGATPAPRKVEIATRPVGWGF